MKNRLEMGSARNGVTPHPMLTALDLFDIREWEAMIERVPLNCEEIKMGNHSRGSCPSS
jgi:hypothetical protein